MRGQPAKVLGAGDIRAMRDAARRRRHPDRNLAMVMLSVKAGLRACEISRLTWPMVTDGRGRVGTVIELPGRAAKKGSGRRIPIHPDLRKALVRLQRSQPDGNGAHFGPIVRSERGGPMTAKGI